MLSSADLDRDALDRRRHQLLGRHLEAAVAVDGPHRAVGPADLGADGGRDREAHRAEAAGVDPRVGLGEPPVLRRPHLVLADAGGEDRALGRGVAQLLQAELRLERVARLARLVGQRELLAPARDAAAPRRRVGLRRCRRPAGRWIALTSSADDVAAVADDRHVGPAHLALLGRVDVDVDDLGVGGEAVDLAGDAVVEAGAEGDQQVAALHRRDGRGVAVHARHAEGQRVVVGERAAGHQRRDDVDAGQLGQLAHLLGGPGLEHAAADVEHRALGGEDQPGRLLDHPRVALGRRAVAGQRRRARRRRSASTTPSASAARPWARRRAPARAGPSRRGGTPGGWPAAGPRRVITSSLCLVAERVMPTVSHSWKASLPMACGRHLAGDGDHRDRVHVGVHQRRHEVRGRRAGRHHGHAGPAR